LSEVLQFVSFYVEDRLYGLDIRMVKEIYPDVDITPVPRSEPQIRGLVNIRGQVVLVKDIAIIFGRAPRPITDDSHIIILKTSTELAAVPTLDTRFNSAVFGDKPVAFLVDRIGDVVTVPAGDVEPAPLHVDETNAGYFAGVVYLDDRLQVILEAGTML
jgi:purine-binding chemotaxis protein CheW